MKLFAVGLLIAAFASSAEAQVAAANKAASSLDLGLGFTTIHANAPPAGCGCFYMLGGSGQVIFSRPSGLGFLLDLGVASKSNINGGGHNLTLTTFMAGARYARVYKSKFEPYGQVLAGIGHSSSNYTIDKSSSSSAFAGGGGLDIKLSKRFNLRMLEADYLLTHVPNGTNNRQNQFRITAGIVVHLAGAKY